MCKFLGPVKFLYLSLMPGVIQRKQRKVICLIGGFGCREEYRLVYVKVNHIGIFMSTSPGVGKPLCLLIVILNL